VSHVQRNDSQGDRAIEDVEEERGGRGGKFIQSRRKLTQ
jgi:hypothetical protein